MKKEKIMQKMTKQEIKKFISTYTWATLCTVDAEGKPYAIEFNYFVMNGFICGLIKPSGTTANNISLNPSVCLKICETDKSARKFTAVSCFGKADFVHDDEGVLKGWDLLEQRLGLPSGAYAKFKEKFMKKKNKYPLFRLKVEKMTGITTSEKEAK